METIIIYNKKLSNRLLYKKNYLINYHLDNLKSENIADKSMLINNFFKNTKENIVLVKNDGYSECNFDRPGWQQLMTNIKA